MRAALAFLLVAASSCSSRSGDERAPVQENAALGGEIAARVNGEPIPLSVVMSVAGAGKLPVEEALRRVVDDAVAAHAAKERGLDRRPPAAWQLEATRARLASIRLLEVARRAGPPNDEEVARLSEVHWAEVDRPPSVRVQHAILLRPKSAADAPRLKAAAPGLVSAVAGARDDADFEAKAKAYFAATGATESSRVESLPPFTDKGVVTEGGGEMDATFAAAAFAISTVGGTSSVVETSFGWHVIRLLERLPERRMPIEMRRIAFAEEVVAHRAHDLLVERLKALQATHPVTISDAADAMMQSVSRSPPASSP